MREKRLQRLQWQEISRRRGSIGSCVSCVISKISRHTLFPSRVFLPYHNVQTCCTVHQFTHKFHNIYLIIHPSNLFNLYSSVARNVKIKVKLKQKTCDCKTKTCCTRHGIRDGIPAKYPAK